MPTNSSMEIIMIELKKLNSQIKAIATNKVKARDQIQIALVGVAQYAFDDKQPNLDPARNLVLACEGAYDIQALVAYIESHMPARWVKETQSFRLNKSFKGEYDAVALMADPWWVKAKKADSVESTFDMLEKVRALLKKAEREVKACKEVKHADMIRELNAICGKFDRADTEAAE